MAVDLRPVLTGMKTDRSSFLMVAVVVKVVDVLWSHLASSECQWYEGAASTHLRALPFSVKTVGDSITIVTVVMLETAPEILDGKAPPIVVVTVGLASKLPPGIKGGTGAARSD